LSFAPSAKDAAAAVARQKITAKNFFIKPSGILNEKQLNYIRFPFVCQ
jgi:hypothetical protein